MTPPFALTFAAQAARRLCFELAFAREKLR